MSDDHDAWNRDCRAVAGVYWSAVRMGLLALALMLAVMPPRAQAAQGPVDLTWDAPTTRTDGSALDPLTEIDAYKIYCRSKADSEQYEYPDGSFRVSQQVLEGRTTYTVARKALLGVPGTYMCAMTAVDTDARESGFSNELELSYDKAAPATFTIHITGG